MRVRIHSQSKLCMETSNGFSAGPDDKRLKCARLCEDCNTQNWLVKYKLQRLEYMVLGEACKYCNIAYCKRAVAVQWINRMISIQYSVSQTTCHLLLCLRPKEPPVKNVN